MKKIVILGFAFLFTMCLSIPTYADIECYVHKKVDWDVDGPGVLKWCDSGKHCLDEPDVNCKMYPCDEYLNGELVNVPGGYTIEMNLNKVELAYKVTPSGPWINYNHDGKNYTFTKHHTLRIVECPLLPGLENILINLEGITTDSNGNYTVFIPAGNY